MVLANTVLQHAAPWSAAADRAAVITRVTLNLVRLCAIAAYSAVPSLSGVVLGAFDDHAAIPHWARRSISEILDGDAGRTARPIGRLIEKLSDTEPVRLKRRLATPTSARPIMADMGQGTNPLLRECAARKKRSK